MQCRLCGYEFTEEEAKKTCQQTQGCKECNCNYLICPNCGFSNNPLFETEDFKFMEKLKKKIKGKN